MKYLTGLIFILIAAEIILTASLVYSDLTQTTFCIIGKDCSIVQSSEYNSILGIKLSTFGLISFIFLFLLYTLAYMKKHYYKPFLVAASFGAILSLYFIYLQIFILKQICANCFIIDVTMIIIYIISFFVFYVNKNN